MKQGKHLEGLKQLSQPIQRVECPGESTSNLRAGDTLVNSTETPGATRDSQPEAVCNTELGLAAHSPHAGQIQA